MRYEAVHFVEVSSFQPVLSRGLGMYDSAQPARQPQLVW